MLTVINLYTIDMIFADCGDVKLKPLTKMLYINCLMHHFRDKKPTVANAVAFSIFINDIPNYDVYERMFQELHKAGLVVIGISDIRFENVWGKHIDRSKLDKVSPQEYVAGFSFSKASGFKDEMLKSDSLIELLQMKHKISGKQIETLIALFVKEQDAFEKQYSSYADCTRHFTYWIPNNVSKAVGETVKTGAKILGL
jgi:hypothetical protein